MLKKPGAGLRILICVGTGVSVLIFVKALIDLRTDLFLFPFLFTALTAQLFFAYFAFRSLNRALSRATRILLVCISLGWLLFSPALLPLNSPVLGCRDCQGAAGLLVLLLLPFLVLGPVLWVLEIIAARRISRE